MFEHVVGTVLSKFLGDYVEGLEGKNLEVNILSGHVVLENLQLKKEALSRYQLPVTIKDGFLGKLILEIPWKSLGTKPVQVKLQNIFLIAKPTLPSDYDPDLANQNTLSSKKRKLEIYEAIKEEEAETELAKDSKQNIKKKSYTQKLIDSATSLFNVEITNIHIRYEDNISNKDSSFTFGVSLENFSATTVESINEFLQQFTANMTNLAMYWNNEDFLVYKNAKEMGELMSRLIYRNSSPVHSHKYILHPVCGSMDLQLNRSLKPDLSIPKLLVSSILEKINISLRENQWKQILYFSDYFTLYSRGLRFHDIRPNSIYAPSQDPMRWWKFLVKGKRQEVRNLRAKWKWERFVEFKRYRMMYIDSWRKKKTLKACPENIVTQLESLENILSYDDIISFRQLAEASMNLGIQIPGESTSAGGGWFSWASWKQTEEEEKPLGDFTHQQWIQLYNQIDFLGENQKKQETNEIPEEYENRKAAFRLQSVSLTLFTNSDDSEHKMVEFGFNGLQVKATQRQVNSSISFQSSITSVTMNDYITLPTNEGNIEMLSLNPHKVSNNATSFLEVEFDQNPLDKSSDIRIVIRALQSLNITFSRNIMNNITKFFSHGTNATQLKQVANENWASVRKNASLQLQSALDHHKRIDLQIDVIAPNIIIPSDFLDDEAPVLIIELGTLSFRSKLDTKQERGKEIVVVPENLNQEDFYDHFDLSITNIRAAVFLRNQDLSTLDPKQCELLSNFDIELSVGVCIISDANLPKLRFKANFPSFLALISPSKLIKLMTVTKAFTKSPENQQKLLQITESEKSISASSTIITNPKEPLKAKTKQMEATFQFGEVSALFHAEKNEKNEETDILLISLQNFQLNALKTTHDFSANLLLNTFFIEDKIQTLEEYRYIISSAQLQSTNLVQISYQNIPKDSPAFKVIENVINVSFDQLDITVNRETLVQVLQFTKRCLAILESPSDDKNIQSIPKDNTLALNDIHQPNNEATEDKNEKTTILFKSETSVTQISLILLLDGEKFVYSALHGFSVNAEAYSNKEFKVSGTIGHITIQDLSKDTLWKEIIKIDDEKILDFWFEVIKPETPQDTGKLILTVEMSSVVCVYLTRFVRRVANYFNEFSQMQALLEATASKAKERARQQASEITKVIIFDITIANPKFIVPKASESPEYALANLGDIIINNEILPQENSNLLDCIKVSISSISLVTNCLSSENEAKLIERAVIPNSNFSFSVHRPLTPEIKNTYAASSIVIDIPDICMSITECQIILFLGILHGNLSEVPASTSKAIQAKLESEIASAKEDLLKKSIKDTQNYVNEQNEEIIDFRPDQAKDFTIKTTLELKIILKQISLELLEGNGVRELSGKGSKGSESTSLACFAISELRLDMKMLEDNTMNLGIAIKRISLEDTRVGNFSCHRNILAPLRHGNEESLWVISYSRKHDGHQSIETSIRSPRILLAPNFLFRLNKTYSRIMNASAILKSNISPVPDLPASIEHLETKEEAKEEANDEKQKFAVQQLVGLTAKVEIINPELCLIEDISDTESRAIIMKESFSIQFSMLDGRQHAQLSISDIQIYKTRMNSEHEPVTILTPFNILLNYSDAPHTLRSAVLEVDPIHFTLAYSDCRLALNIRDRWTESMQPDGVVTNEKPAASPNEKHSDEVTPQSLDTKKKDINSKESAEKLKSSESESEKKKIGEEHAKIILGAVSIVLLNDCNAGDTNEAPTVSSVVQRPLAAFLFEEISVSLANWSSDEMNGSMSLNQLQALYYNNQLNTFEPMIEKFDFIANLGRQEDLQVKLGSSQPLNINITKKFIETILLSLEQWENDSATSNDSGAREKPPFFPYYIHNATGVPLTYWITNSNQKHRERVENNSRVPLNLQNLESTQRTRFSLNLSHENEMKQDAMIPQLSIQMEDYDLVPLHNLIFHKQVSYLFQDISNRNKNISLHYNVKYEDGSRVIFLGSDISIYNDTVVPLQVLLESPMLAAFYMDPIQPGSYASLPIRYAEESQIKVRPFEFAYDWSRESIRCTNSMKEKIPGFFSCRSKDPKNKTAPHWLYSIEQKGVRSKNLGLSFENDHNVEIHIKSPFKVENTLPCKVSYLIRDPSGVNLTSGTLAIGATAEIHQVLSDHRPILHIRIPEFEWSEGVKVGPSRKHSLRLFNKQNEAVKIHIQAEQTRSGARSCSLYANYWIINQTGTKLYYRESIVRQSKTLKSESSIVSIKEFQTPEMTNLSKENIILPVGNPETTGIDFLSENETIFAKPVIFSEKELVIRSNHTVWSDRVFLQQSGGVVNLPEKRNTGIGQGTPAACQFGVLVKSAPGKFWRTSIVYIRPYCILINKLQNSGQSLSFQQAGVPASAVDVHPGEQIPFHWFQYRSPHNLQMKKTQKNTNWSSPFFMDAAANFHLPLTIQEKQNDKADCIRVKITASLSSIIATFSDPENDEPDYIIKNNSQFDLIIGQHETKETILVSAHSSIPYCWCIPLMPKRKLHVSVSHSKVEMKANLDKLRQYAPLYWQGSEGEYALDIEVTADGLTKILKINNANLSISNENKKLQRISFNSDSATSLIAQTQSMDIIGTPNDGQTRFTVALELTAIGISIIDEKPTELILLTIENLQILYCMGHDSQSIQMNIQSLQIDNQLFSTGYPLLLYSRPVQDQPFFQLSMLRSSRYSHLRYIPYFAVKLQEIDFKIEEVCLLRILHFIESISDYVSSRKVQEEENQLFLHSPTFQVSEASLESHSGSALFFELLHINPIRINLSFCSTGADTELGTQTMFEKSLRAGGFLANIDGAPLRLNGLILENPMCTQEDLISRITKHYTLQLMAETYKILGSIDILGSPVSLVNTLGTGVYDFFHEPVEGTVTNPREFAAGLARGTESLVKNSVFGIFNSASKISGSISKAATTISLDDEWQQSRAKKFRNKPSDVGEGLSSGFKRLGMGIFDGVTGVVSQPIKGLNEDGGAGLARGVGKGISGLLLRPMVGVVDLITDTTEGIKNQAENSQFVKERKRMPRYIGMNHILLPYDPEKSYFQFLLRTIEDCKFEKHFYKMSWTITANHFVLLSDKRIFSFTSSKGNPSIPKLNWAIPIPEIRDINMMDHGVNILLRNGKNIVFDAHQKTAESIKNNIWQLMNHRKSSAVKQLEYHLVEDKSGAAVSISRELKEARDSSLPPDSPQRYSSDDLCNSTNSLETIPTSSRPVGEKTPLLITNPRQPARNSQRLTNSSQRPRRGPPRRKEQEEECCSCSLL